MRTARLLPVSPSMHCAGVGLLPGGGSARGGRGMLLRGLLTGGWGGIPAWTGEDPSPLCTEFLTHTTENITLPQLRRGR